MSFQKVKEFFESRGAGDKVMEFTHSSATVELAAEAVGCEPARIAKTMSFLQDDRAGRRLPVRDKAGDSGLARRLQATIK